MGDGVEGGKGRVGEVVVEAVAVVGVPGGGEEEGVDEDLVRQGADEGRGKAVGHGTRVAVVGVVEVRGDGGVVWVARWVVEVREAHGLGDVVLLLWGW